MNHDQQATLNMVAVRTDESTTRNRNEGAYQKRLGEALGDSLAARCEYNPALLDTLIAQLKDKGLVWEDKACGWLLTREGKQLRVVGFITREGEQLLESKVEAPE